MSQFAVMEKTVVGITVFLIDFYSHARGFITDYTWLVKPVLYADGLIFERIKVGFMWYTQVNQILSFKVAHSGATFIIYLC